MNVFYILVYLLFAYYATRWNRGVLPVVERAVGDPDHLRAVAAPAWFERDKDGFDSPALPESLLGLLTLSLIPLALLLIVFAMRGLPAELEHRGRQPRRPRGARAPRRARATPGPPLDPGRDRCSGHAGAAPPRHRGARRPGALRGHRARLRRPAPEGLGIPAALPARRARRLHRHRLDEGAARGARAVPGARASAACSSTATCASRPTTAGCVEERKNARAAFGGRRNLWWDDLDLLYFGGYALWGYVVAPFIFTRPDFEVEEIEPWREGGEEWPGLRVRFPEDVPAHSREQRYYFGPDGLIRRNDYTAEVFGGWAKAAHYCWDYRDFGGFKIPTRRAAMPRGPGGRPVRAIRMVRIAIDDVRVE